MEKRKLAKIPREEASDEMVRFAERAAGTHIVTTKDIEKDLLMVTFYPIRKLKKGKKDAQLRTFFSKNDYISQDLTVEKVKWLTAAYDRMYDISLYEHHWDYKESTGRWTPNMFFWTDADIDFWFDQLKEKEEGLNADYLSIETYRANKKKEISQICQSTVFAGVDISISSGTEHFSLKDEDQLNLFGKQAQLTAGIKKLEYHEDGNPCRYYSAEDMQKIINGAMEFKSYHTTYANSLNMWIKGCSKASEIAKIEYGAPIPEEYQSEVLKDYLAEMAADKEVK